jgi:hypothetical protein
VERVRKPNFIINPKMAAKTNATVVRGAETRRRFIKSSMRTIRRYTASARRRPSAIKMRVPVGVVLRTWAMWNGGKSEKAPKTIRKRKNWRMVVMAFFMGSGDEFIAGVGDAERRFKGGQLTKGLLRRAAC